MVTGPPGAGKSTVAGLLAQHVDPSALVAGDDFFAFLARGAVAPWLPEAHEQNVTVLAAAAAAAGRLAAGGLTVVYDGVVRPCSLADFVNATDLDHVSYAVLLPPEELCLTRVATRADHGFTDVGAARRMYRDFERAVREQAVEQRHVLLGPHEDPAGTALLLLDLHRSGALLHPREQRISDLGNG